MKEKLAKYLILVVAAASAITAVAVILVSAKASNGVHVVGLTIFIWVVVTVLASGLGAVLMFKVVKPPSPDEAEEGEGYDEFRPLIRRIGEQRRELHENRKELEDKERKLASITENMTEGLILLDGEGLVVLMNKGAGRLLGTVDKNEGQHIFTICGDNLLQAAVHSAMGGSSSRETFARGGLLIQAIASPVVVDGVANGVVLMLLDVTERMAAEDMRREFTANVSHELKTPITSISGYAEMMMTGMAKAEDLPKLSGKIYTEAQRMIALIADIIRLSRLDEGSVESVSEPVELFGAAKKCVERLEEKAERCGVTVSLTGTEHIIRGAAQLIDELVMNLCDNAIKYNQPGGHVWVYVGERNGVALLSVTDDGIGIEPEHMERIFERFYRVEKSRSKETGGTGLGLSIVKHAAAWHRATIDADSVPGRGTRIVIIFEGKGEE